MEVHISCKEFGSGQGRDRTGRGAERRKKEKTSETKLWWLWQSCCPPHCTHSLQQLQQEAPRESSPPPVSARCVPSTPFHRGGLLIAPWSPLGRAVLYRCRAVRGGDELWPWLRLREVLIPRWRSRRRSGGRF